MSEGSKPTEQLVETVLDQKFQAFPDVGKDAAPAALQEEVFSTLDMVNFLAELTEFFTVKFTEAELAVFTAANEAIRKTE